MGAVIAIIFIWIVVTAFIIYFSGSKKPKSSVKNPKQILDEYDFQRQYIPVSLPTVPKRTPLPYVRREGLLNLSERQCYIKLMHIIPSGYIVIPQVVLTNLVNAKWNQWVKWYRGRRSKIDKKTVDFAVFSTPNLVPVLAIEYNWPTHNQPDRKERDEFVKKVLEDCGIGLYTITYNSVDYEKVKRDIYEYLHVATPNNTQERTYSEEEDLPF